MRRTRILETSIIGVLSHRLFFLATTIAKRTSGSVVKDHSAWSLQETKFRSHICKAGILPAVLLFNSFFPNSLLSSIYYRMINMYCVPHTANLLPYLISHRACWNISSFKSKLQTNQLRAEKQEKEILET